MPIDYSKRRGSGSSGEEPSSAGKIDYSRRDPRPAAPTPPAPTPPVPTPPVPTPPAEAPAAPAPPVSLSKVVLTKASPTVSLTKSGGGTGSMRLNLRWTARPGGGGFFSRAKPIDLDLGCLYEFTDGSKGVVQALGRSFVAKDRQGRALVTLDGDDRSGSGAGENIHVDLSRPRDISRILFFAMIYEGAPNWAAAEAVVTVYPQSGPEIETRLDATSDRARICAIALLEETGGELVLRRENTYIEGAQDVLDRTYGWGLNWRAGRK